MSMNKVIIKNFGTLELTELDQKDFECGIDRLKTTLTSRAESQQDLLSIWILLSLIEREPPLVEMPFCEDERTHARLVQLFFLLEVHRNDLALYYFGSVDPKCAEPPRLLSGIRRCLLDLENERSDSKRMLLWGFLEMLGSAPSPRAIFESLEGQRAAAEFRRRLWTGKKGSDNLITNPLMNANDSAE